MKVLSSREVTVLVAVICVALVMLMVYLLRSGVSCIHQSHVTVSSTGLDLCSQTQEGSRQTQCSTPADPADRTSKPENQSRIAYYRSQISHPVKLDTKCTLVVPTYKRVRMLIPLINNYCSMSATLQKIVVVWNDIDSAIDSSVLNLISQCRPELKIIKMKKNKLSNRFLPGNYSKEIETECEYHGSQLVWSCKPNPRISKAILDIK